MADTAIEQLGWLARASKAWAVLRGIPEPPPLKWTDQDVKDLAENISKSNREPRLLLLFCEGGRATIPGTELTRKFGCGSPLEVTRDLPRTSAFCATRNPTLPSPILESGGSKEEPAYTLVWTRDQARLFVEPFKGKLGRAGPAAPPKS